MYAGLFLPLLLSKLLFQTEALNKRRHPSKVRLEADVFINYNVKFPFST